MKASTVLKKSLSLMETRGWTKGTAARNKYRHSVKPTNPNAVKYCAIGAVCAVMKEDINDLPSSDYRTVENYLRSETPYEHSVDSFNDRDKTSFEDIRQVFKRAIKSARSDGN